MDGGEWNLTSGSTLFPVTVSILPFESVDLPEGLWTRASFRVLEEAMWKQGMIDEGFLLSLTGLVS